jgi:hypothetical protein
LHKFAYVVIVKGSILTMDKLLKLLGVSGITAVLGIIVIFIFGLYILIQRSCDKGTLNPKLEDRIINDTKHNTYDFDLMDLKLKVNEYRDTKYADITEMTNHEYVKGNIGIYYSVDLKDSDSPAPTVILFPAGEYSYKDNDWKFVKSLDNVKATVLSGILKGKKYKIFIEGQADKAGDNTFTRKFLPNYAYRKIDFYPTYKSNISTTFFYDSTPTTVTLTEPLKNTDLPLLRASYLNEKLLRYGDEIPKPIILEGEVKNGVGAEYRNGTIILFIDTTQNQK